MNEKSQKQKLLFLCTGNSCRSQMAEGLLRNLAGDQFDVVSAGTHPNRVHPMSIKIMDEIDIDISHHSSDHVADYLNQGIDIIISVCDSAKQLCPTFPGNVKQIHWSISDPFSGWDTDDEFLHNYRDCRDTIQKYIKQFLEDN